MDSPGFYYDAGTGKTLQVQRQPFGVASSGDNTLLAAQGGSVRVLAMTAILSAQENLYFTSGTGGAVIFGDSTNKIPPAANGGWVMNRNEDGWMQTGVNAALVVNKSGSGVFAGGFTYVVIPPN